ncbi:MAG TPA: SH3 domain-containing protein [Allosphingosinicella sp.]|nr:SH3 domain-containing protein [Allosphingosinicella sp.]
MIKALLLALMLQSGGGPARVPPVDECASDLSFLSFRDDLRKVIERRDGNRLLEIVSDDIDVDFGGGEGRAYFAKAWGLDRPRDSKIWQELGETLALGCAQAAGEDIYWSPSLFVHATGDPFESVVAVAPQAALHEAPDAASPVVTLLAWDVLTVGDDDGQQPWLRAALADGRTGYVRREHVRSLLDYRAGFARRHGRWRLVAFIAGD